MNIGIVCYASVGGSGVVATELGYALAARGHSIVLISTDRPFRWREGAPNTRFEPVVVPQYPLFREPQYLLALSTAIARVAESDRLDIVHAHYAVPHATAAYLADQMLASTRQSAPRVMTTLHGTDITLVGSDPSYKRVVAFSIERSDVVTAVSRSLRADTIAALAVRKNIQVIPNFLDCGVYRRREDPELRASLCPPDRYDALVIHASNFRPVKRVEAAVDVFARIRARVRARLALVGDGPSRDEVARHAEMLGVADDVLFAGEQRDIVAWLSASDLFLLPSSQESFGLAALEAMACEVPVVASRVGGLPEIIEHNETGFLHAPEDLDGMTDSALRVLLDKAVRQKVGGAAAESVRTRFCAERIVPQYEAAYRAALTHTVR